MAIHTLSIGGSNYEIQPKYASSAGYATTAGYAVTAGRARYATTASYAASARYANHADTANTAIKVDSTLTINIGNTDGNDYYVDYDGSEDILIDSIAYANTARKTQRTLTIEHDFDGNTTEWDGSSNESINSIAWAQVAGAVNLPLTVLTAAGTMTYNGSTAVHITNVSYGCSAGMANIANFASSASYANYSKYLHAATSTSKLYLLGQTTGITGGNLVYKNTNTYISSNAIYASAGFYESSDARLKTITNDVEVDFERLKSIPKIQYIKKGETAPHIGTIAQDLQKVYPEFVETGEDGYMSVDYAKLSIIPLKAVDILYDEMNKLKNELKIVKEENQMLKDRLDNIESIINK